MMVKWVLRGVFVLFVAIMVGVWVLSHRAHPVLLDERGQPVHASDHGHPH